jgi:hypothetical protein
MYITMSMMAAGARVPIAPPAPGMVPAGPPFALNPEQIAMTTVIDYASLEGHQVFREGSKSLYSDSNKFALTSDWIQSFLQSLKIHGGINGWDVRVNVGNAVVPEFKSLINSYSEILLQQIQDPVENGIIIKISNANRQTI